MKYFRLLIVALFVATNCHAVMLPEIDTLDRAQSIEEEDGSPSVYDVSKLKVPNTSLMDNGDGTVSLDFVGGSLPTTYLRLDCTNDPLTAALDIYGNVSSYDAGHTKYIRIAHDGTSANVSSNSGDISILAPGTTDINLRLGDNAAVNKVSIQDSGNIERAYIDSDGNFVSLSGIFTAYGLGGTEYGFLYHDGADALLGSSAGDVTVMTASDVNVLLSDAAGASYFRVQDSGVNTVASIDSDGALTLGDASTYLTFDTVTNPDPMLVGTFNQLSSYSNAGAENIIYSPSPFFFDNTRSQYYDIEGIGGILISGGIWDVTTSDGDPTKVGSEVYANASMVVQHKRTGTINSYNDQVEVNVTHYLRESNNATYSGSTDHAVLEMAATADVVSNLTLNSAGNTLTHVKYGVSSNVEVNDTETAGTLNEYICGVNASIDASGVTITNGSVMMVGLNIDELIGPAGATVFGIYDNSIGSNWKLADVDKYIEFNQSTEKIGSDDAGHLDLFAATSVDLNIGTTEQIVLTDGKLSPTTNNDIDLGDATHKFKDVFIGTLKPDAIEMALDELIELGDGEVNIASLDDGHLDLTADVSIDLNGAVNAGANSITTTGKITAGDLDITGAGARDITIISTDHTTCGLNLMRIGNSYTDWRLFSTGGNLQLSYSANDGSSWANALNIQNKIPYWENVGEDSGSGVKHNMEITDKTAFGINEGACFTLAGLINAGGAEKIFAGFGGRKESAVSGEYGGYAAIYTRPNGGDLTEAVRWSSLGDMDLGSHNLTTTGTMQAANVQLGFPYSNYLTSAGGELKIQANARSLWFDSVDDYVTIANDSTANAVYGSTAFSVETWFYVDTDGENDNGRLASKRPNTDGWDIYTSNQSGSLVRINFAVDRANTDATASTSTSVKTDMWHHLVISWNGGDGVGNYPIIYIDGVESAYTGTPTGGDGAIVDDTGNSLYLGDNSTATRGFDGAICLFRIYRNTALSQSEVTTLYNKSTVTGATAEYLFLEGSGATLTDTVDTNNGTITNAAWSSNNENLVIDFDDVSNLISIQSTSGASSLYTNLYLHTADDIGFRFGDRSNPDSSFQWVTTGNDHLGLSTTCNSSNGSGHFIICTSGDLTDADRSPLAVSVDPVLRIYSSDDTSATDYIEFFHNQTNAVIQSGGGELQLTAATTRATGDLYVGNNADVDPAIVFDGDTSDGQIGYDEDNDRFSLSSVARTSTSLYRRYYHIPAQKVNPGASGASWVDPDANTVGGWRITADAQTLIFSSDIHSDWDGASDIIVEVYFAVGAAGNPNDTIDLKLTSYYNAVGDSATKTQNQTVPTTTDGTQYKVYKAVFTIDHDIGGGNDVEADDQYGGILNLVTASSEIDNAIILHATMYYQTAHIGIEAGDI